MQCSTTIQGLLLVNVNITLLLKVENNISRNILLAEQLANCSYLILVREASCTFNTELFAYRCRIKSVLQPRGVALWAMCITASWDLGSHRRTEYQSASYILQSLSEFNYSCTFASSNGLWTPNFSLLQMSIFLETRQWDMITVTSFYFARSCGSIGNNLGITKRATVFRLKNTLLKWPLVT